jgi:two-component system cell cycle sensor histidine kinase/response regulator CckA
MSPAPASRALDERPDSDALSRSPITGNLVHDSTRLLSEVCEAAAFVCVLDGGRMRIESRVGIDEAEAAGMALSCIEAVNANGELTELSDPRFCSARFFAGAPLDVATEVTGALVVLDRRPRTLTRVQRNALAVTARQISTQLIAAHVEERFERTKVIYRDLVEHVPAVSYLAEVGELGKWHYVSPQIESLTGYTPQEWMRDPSLWFDTIHPDDRDAALESEWSVWNSLASGKRNTVHYRMIARDGSVKWVADDGEVVADDNGEPLYFRGVLMDVTNVIESENARQTLEDELRQSQKVDAVGRLAGGVAHDFNNLLSVILSYSDFLLEEIHESDPKRADLEEIQKAGRRASSLVRQLLAFSRKELVNPELLDLNEVVDDMGNLLRRTIGEHVELVTEPATQTWPVKVDRGQVEQVLANLVLNARDAMEAGGSITIHTRNVSAVPGAGRGRFVCIDVQDTGEGIPETVKPHIFEPFFTTKPRGRGTGLGLSSVSRIVEYAGGHITVDSTVGHGTMMSVYLPASSFHEAHAREGEIEGSGQRGTGTILVVEDEEGVRRIVERILARNGYDVLTAASGKQALALSESHIGGIDLLLTDVVMPQMSGKELAETLAPIRPDMKIAYMSGYTDDIILRSTSMSDSTDLLHKPFTADDLLAKVRSVLTG